MDSVLRPRDIQARIRSGESPESVAAAAQTTVEKIIGFATPVLAERAYVAEQAQKASVRRRAGDGAIGTLGQAVAERLATRDVDPETVEWDAWRREDGRWTLVADFGAGHSSRRASFVYDTAGRYVVADDDESRWLVGERHGSAPEVTSAPERTPEPGRRLSAVSTEQVSLGDDAIEVVTGQRPAEPVSADPFSPRPVAPPVTAHPVSAAREDPTVDLTEASSAVRSPVVSGEPEALFDAPAAPVVPQRQAEARVPAGASDEPADELAGQAADELADGDDEGQQAAEPQQRKASRSRGRASVPSWDEIMFGSSRGE